MNNMKWDDLKILLAIGRQGSLTAAAQELGVDQSTVGRRLSALEADLGAVLFVRSKTGFAATDAGEVALMHAAELGDKASQLIDAVADPELGAVGTVRLVGNAWTLDRLISHSGSGFLAANPKLQLRIVTLMPKSKPHGEPTLSLWFERKKIDGEFSISLGKVPYAAYKHKDIDIENHNWVAFYDEDFERPAIARALLELRKNQEHVHLTATDAGLLFSAVKAGIGCGLLPVCLAKNHPDLVRINKGPPEFSRMLRLHLHPDTLETKRIQATITWIREVFDDVFLAD